MSQTDDLLGLIDEFPQAFADPETQADAALAAASFLPTASAAAMKTQQLLQLIDEFPQAFADPEALPAQPILETRVEPETTTATPAPTDTSAQVEATATPAIASLPPGYAQALRRQILTQTWGRVDCHLVYGEQGLQEIWVTVGKSGTEIQSLCEAIARLVNLLLAQQVAIPEITRQLRGIRGADSEGLGPHRILGLADLIGKVLQEAPAIPVQTIAGATFAEMRTSDRTIPPALTTPATDLPAVHEPAIQATAIWQALPEDAQETALCPECGAELQQINGCTGGACVVCGYSSCS